MSHGYVAIGTYDRNIRATITILRSNPETMPASRMVHEPAQAGTGLRTVLTEPWEQESPQVTVTRACIDMIHIVRHIALGAIPAALVTGALSVTGEEIAPAIAATTGAGIIWGCVQAAETRRSIDRSLKELRRHYRSFRTSVPHPKGETTRVIEKPGEPATVIRVVPE